MEVFFDDMSVGWNSNLTSSIVLCTITMKHKKIISIIIAAAVAVGVIAWWGKSHGIDITSPETISGRVTNISNECRSDGTCSVALDNSKLIVTGCGLMAGGITCKSYDQSKLHIGQQVEATVIKAKSGMYNLECDSCTIRVIK